MTVDHLLDNLLPWVAQVSVISLLGTVLPLLFGVRHPRAQLTYGYGVLAVCLLLPLLQPWQPPPTLSTTRATLDAAPTVSASTPAGATPAPATSNVSSPAGSSASVPDRSSTDATPAIVSERGAVVSSGGEAAPAVRASSIWSWSWIVFAVFAAGIVFRLGRLLLGAWQIRRYRLASTPMFPVPDSVAQAAAMVGARALVCVSTHVSSPATLGVFRPVVLMPPSFMTLSHEAQVAVTCHELLHVRRRDWLTALWEGLVGAVLWFTPVAWLISEIRLAREQIVDAEVIRLTSATDSYIRALLDIARARPTLDIVPAPLFIRRRHLTHRVQALLDNASDSLRRLSLCYASAVALLMAGGWGVVVLFPLVAIPQPVQAAVREPATRTVPQPTTSAMTATLPENALGATPAVAPNVAASALTEPAPGNDPIVGPVDSAEGPDARADALSLLERARQNSNLHIAGTPSFHLEATFVASGDVANVGSGTITETWISGQRWRWTADLGPYSQIRIGSGQTGFDALAQTMSPTRLQTLREMVFAPVRVQRPMQIRLAAGRVARVAVTCVLTGPQGAPPSTARHWNEEEHCIDASGLLRVYSPALGSYTRFDYSRPLRFGGRILPNGLTTFLGGVEVLAARLTIRDAGTPDSEQFAVSEEMNARGLGPQVVRAPNLHLPAPPDRTVAGGPVVVVHVSVDPSGRLVDAELASRDQNYGPLALEIVRAYRFASSGTQRDGYIGVDFGTSNVVR